MRLAVGNTKMMVNCLRALMSEFARISTLMGQRMEVK